MSDTFRAANSRGETGPQPSTSLPPEPSYVRKRMTGKRLQEKTSLKSSSPAGALPTDGLDVRYSDLRLPRPFRSSQRYGSMGCKRLIETQQPLRGAGVDTAVIPSPSRPSRSCQVEGFKADSTPRYGLTAHPRAQRYWGAIHQLDSTLCCLGSMMFSFCSGLIRIATLRPDGWRQPGARARSSRPVRLRPQSARRRRRLPRRKLPPETVVVTGGD